MQPRVHTVEDSFLEDVDTSVGSDVEDINKKEAISAVFIARDKMNYDMTSVSNQKLKSSLTKKIEQDFIEDVPTPTSNIYDAIQTSHVQSLKCEDREVQSRQGMGGIKMDCVTADADNTVTSNSTTDVEAFESEKENFIESGNLDELSGGHQQLEGYRSISTESEENVNEESYELDSEGYQAIPRQSKDSQELHPTADTLIDEYEYAFPGTWVLQPDIGDGIVRFESKNGPIRIIMNLEDGGINYPNPPNELLLELDVDLKHIPSTSRIAAGCQLFVDTGRWRLQLDADIANILLRMDISQDFKDVTGEVLWNDSKDITIENLSRARNIYQDSDLDDSPVRLFLANDSVYKPKDAAFRLDTDHQILNRTKDVRIANGMNFVKNNTTVAIPDTSNTDVRNLKRTMIFEDCVLENQVISHLDSGCCHVEPTPATFLISEDSKFEDQGTRLVINEDVKLEDQGKRLLVYEDSESVDIVREVMTNEDSVIRDIVRGLWIPKDSDSVDIKRHMPADDNNSIKINRTPAVWTESKFDSDLLDLKEDRLELDVKYSISPSKFKLNALEVDADLLKELSAAGD